MTPEGMISLVPATLRPFLVIAAAFACLVLVIVVLVGHPANQLSLLAWAGVAAGTGLLLLVVPVERT
jgi:hypothetical protein